MQVRVSFNHSLPRLVFEPTVVRAFDIWSHWSLNCDQGCTSLTTAMLSFWKREGLVLMFPKRARLVSATTTLCFQLSGRILSSKSAQGEGSTLFRYPSYVQDIMGDIFSLGFGPFRWTFIAIDQSKCRVGNCWSCAELHEMSWFARGV